MDENFFLKFPEPFCRRLCTGEVCFPRETMFDYDPIHAYRVVTREKDQNYHMILLDDFKSYFELGRSGKARGISDECSLHAASLFKNRESLKQLFKLPKPYKRIIKGYVKKEGGPQRTRDDGHVDWWLYKNADVSHFVIDESVI